MFQSLAFNPTQNINKILEVIQEYLLKTQCI